MTANNNFLKKIREERNLTQEQLSKLSGVGRDSISNYENGKIRPNPRSIAKLCEVLECSYSYLLTGKERSSFKQETEIKSVYVREAFTLVNSYVEDNFKEITGDVLMQISMNLARMLQEYEEASEEKRSIIISEHNKNIPQIISNIIFLQKNKS